jgi:hypothetical protein
MRMAHLYEVILCSHYNGKKCLYMQQKDNYRLRFRKYLARSHFLNTHSKSNFVQ